MQFFFFFLNQSMFNQTRNISGETSVLSGRKSNAPRQYTYIRTRETRGARRTLD